MMCADELPMHARAAAENVIEFTPGPWTRSGVGSWPGLTYGPGPDPDPQLQPKSAGLRPGPGPDPTQVWW